MPVPIPSPKKLPYIGNLREIDTEQPLHSLIQLASIHGPIYRLTVAGRSVIIVSSYELLNELCDETRFQKAISANFRQIRNAVSDGLFTAYPEEPNWGQAHRILMPTFGPLGISKMFDEMHDIATQMVLKWARHGEDHQINITEDFTRLTLDSIALCAMGARLNSFYSNEVHPFVKSMVSFLVEAGNRGRRPPILNDIKRSSKKGFYSDIDCMRDFAEKLYTERLNEPNDKNDLLNAMINGRDKETGEGMSKESIINNMITFLVAGHETTSGLLSFLFYQLIHNPESYQKAQAEVDAVIGTGPINVGHMTKLPYLTACLRETLRLTPTAPAITLKPVTGKGSQLLGGKYELEEDQNVMALLYAAHRDKAIYGEDAMEFKPERMLDESFNALPRNAWKPFGNGVRACIGRAFAWQESLIISVLLLQKFNLRFHDPQYQLQIKETLTLKPKNLVLRARLRSGVDLLTLERDLLATNGVSSSHHEVNGQRRQSTVPQRSQNSISILYGSNTGTCEALATSLVSASSEHGFSAIATTLDAAVDKILPNSTVVVITASFEGAPADNAALFYTWLEALSPGKLSGVKFAVFGCGHHDWATTYQRIPKLLDAMFEGKGATRMCPRGEADAGADSIFNVFDEWLDDHLWPAAEKFGSASQIGEDGIKSIHTTPPEVTHAQTIEKEPHFRVIENRLLTAEGEPPKHHVALELPEGVNYTAGDYLTVFAENDSEVVSRVCEWFDVDLDGTSRMNGITKDALEQKNETPSVRETLRKHVELNQPATKKNLMTITTSISVDSERKALQELVQNPDRLSQQRISALDLLECGPSATLSIEAFMAMLPPLRARQYSISSSPLSDPTTCTISFGVVRDAREHHGSKPFIGLASNYLAGLKSGDTVRASVRPSRHAFHLPLDIENTPIIMIAAGSGLAPFRGFIQERAALIEADRKVAPALLIFGCRSPTKDFLYAEELEEWTKMGAVDIRPAFSREPERSHGCKYVQDRLWQDREDVKRIYREGGKIFMCASNAVNEGVRQTASKIVMEQCEEKGLQVSPEEVEEWLKAMRQERVASDVFG